MIAETLADAVQMNYDAWGTLSDDEKHQNNALYFKVFNDVKGMYAPEGKLPYGMSEAGVNNRISIFLAGRGYMRGDENMFYKPPQVVK